MVREALRHYWGGLPPARIGVAGCAEALDDHKGNNPNALRSILQQD
jgi:hypothetical protein